MYNINISIYYINVSMYNKNEKFISRVLEGYIKCEQNMMQW